MSAVTAYSGPDLSVAPFEDGDRLASVIDLNQVRRLRGVKSQKSPMAGRQSRSQVDDASARLSPIERIQLESSIRSHPASVSKRLAADSVSRRLVADSVSKRLAAERVSERIVAGSPKPVSGVATQAIKPVRYVTAVPLYAKAMAWAAAFVLVVAGAVGLGSAFNSGTYQGETWTHTVASGESLWGLAASLGSQRPLEDVVEDIRALNGLTDATLLAGQKVVLPAN